jgi:hypothetical protein
MAADANSLAQFMSSIAAVESGGEDSPYTAYGTDQGNQYGVARGKYQIMSKIWGDSQGYGGWAEQAGYGGADWRDPYAQEAVTAFKMNQYWNRFQDWDMVAVAWFSGVGGANDVLANPSRMDSESDGFNSIREYVNKVRTAGGKATPPSSGARTGAQQPLVEDGPWPVGVSGEAGHNVPDAPQSARQVSMSVMNNLSRLVQANPESDDVRAQVEKSLSRVYRGMNAGSGVGSPSDTMSPTSPSSPMGSTAQNGPR